MNNSRTNGTELRIFEMRILEKQIDAAEIKHLAS